MINSKTWALLAALGLLSAALASGEGTSDQHLRKTLRNGSHTAEVDVENSKVTVRLRRDTDDNPQSLVLTLFDKNDRPTTLELKTLAPSLSDEPGVSTYTGNLIDGRTPGDSASTLSLAQQSFVGIELSIPLTKGASEILRFKPLD